MLITATRKSIVNISIYSFFARFSLDIPSKARRGALSAFLIVFSILSVLAVPIIAEPIDITEPGDLVVGYPFGNTDWPGSESPENAINNDSATKYLHFLSGGVYQTGFAVTPTHFDLIVTGITITTANDNPERDPISFELYGSNESIYGPSFDLISAGEISETSQTTPLGRLTQISPITFSNSIAYEHYLLIFTDARDYSTANSIQVGEVQLLGIQGDGWPPSVDAGDDQILVLPESKITLNASLEVFGNTTVEDVDLQWQLVSAPEGVQESDLFSNGSQFTLNPYIQFPQFAGMYVLKLIASTVSDTVEDVVVIVVSESLCPDGDITEDCLIDMQDLADLASEWLNSSWSIDLDGQNNGVGISDFAVIADNWDTHGPKAVISEFMAVNSAKYPAQENELLDEDNESSDWIEICNPTDQPVDLTGWYLTNNESNLNKWEIPSLVLYPEEFIVIFASDKDRTEPGMYLHTNFTLSSDPGFLALVEPDGKTIAHQYNYSAQYGLLSYGLASPEAQPSTEIELVSPYAPAYALIPTEDLGSSWLTTDFNDDSWLSGYAGVGYEGSSGYEPYIGIDVLAMRYNISSTYIRIPFQVNDLTGLSQLTLEMMYDDGFVAYINGTPVASANAPETLEWDSTATDKHDDYLAVTFQTFNLPDVALEYLKKGENILAIHGLNENNSSSDFLINPKLTVTQEHSISITSLVESYFPTPTPFAQNSGGQMRLGPIVSNVTENPTAPLPDSDLLITAEVSATNEAVSQVEMVYRIGFDSEIAVAMTDDGVAPDITAADGIYSAVIPSSAYSAGSMVRWFVRTTDTQGSETRDPIYLLNENSPQYYGTIVQNPAIQSNVPVFQYYLQNLTAAATETGTRCSVYFNGEFYDNVKIERRGGNTTAGRKIHFNDGYHFRFNDDYERVDEINLNERGRDASFLRPLLAFDDYETAGVACSLVEPWHIIRNNEFIGIRIFIEQPDSHLLRRLGLDDNGSFYKVYSDLSYGSPDEKPDEQVERKITRLDEDNSDLYDLRAGISPDNLHRTMYMFDNVNIPAVISYLAACVIMQENDHTHKNYFLYRDTENTGEWMFIPWDKDLTYGLSNGISEVFADYDWPGDVRSPSHPFFGSQNHQKFDYQWNRLFEAIFAEPVTREMYLRRLRTLMDQLLQPESTQEVELKYEQRLDDWLDLLSYELYTPDYAHAVSVMKTYYFPARRHHLYVNHLHGSSWADDPAQIPDAQPETFDLQFGAIEFSPASGNQDHEYIEIINPNDFAVDISNWQVKGAVEHTFAGGTVIPSNNHMFLAANALAFRHRLMSPSGGERLFVQGNYKGHLSSWGETISIYDDEDNLVMSTTYEGNPSDQQRYLRVSEIMYNALAPDLPQYTDSDYEYIELVNIGTSPLSLDGVSFTEGIMYDFADGIVLAADERIVLAKNINAFHSRYNVAPGIKIVSGYEGNLSNAGETIKLEDQTNSTILDFEYKDSWYDITDGEGFTLIIRDPAGDRSLWGDKSGWRPGEVINGTPGTADSGQIPALGSVVINELLAHSDTAQYDWIELHNITDQPINIGGWYLSDNNNDDIKRKKYQIAEGTIIPANGYKVFYENIHFGNESDPGCSIPFQLSENGETVYLQSGLDGVLTGYYTEESFGASQRDVAFGRYQKSSGSFNFVAMSANTPGADNAYPLVGPVVITEIMYHPANDSDAEYIELENVGGIPVTLFDIETGIAWRLVDDKDDIGLEFNFPVDSPVTMLPGEKILLVKDLAAFTAEYGAPASSLQVYQWLDGSLSNKNEQPELQMPGDVDNSMTQQYIRVDRVSYEDDLPWPNEADGDGMSLTRISDTNYGNDVVNWQAASPTPGL